MGSLLSRTTAELSNDLRLLYAVRHEWISCSTHSSRGFPWHPLIPATDANVAPVQTAESSQFAPCPNCRQKNAKKVSWTLWGGALGPWMFNHVKCNACRSTFNGKTGRSNTTAIVIYLVVSLVLGVVIFGALSLAMQV